MTNTIIKAPCIDMVKLESLFIEMTNQNCNLRCKYCYIDFKDKKVKDFIPIDKIKQTLALINREELQYIHLTGAEPMLHPDFNHILRLCLKYSSVIIHTNALNINDKKARFLKKVEKENDLQRGRGSYRKAIHAIQSLIKYDFNPILSIVNYMNLPKQDLINSFKELCSSFNFETSDINFNIIPLMKKDEVWEINDSCDFDKLNVECAKSRTLTVNGVFTCPLLSSDNRGKCGSDFSDYSKRSYLETPFCSQCIVYNQKLFSLDL